MKPCHFRSNPVEKIQGEITVPGDKSISHRSIILGAIAKGTTTVANFLPGEDCLATLNAFKLMGVAIEQNSPQRITIHGVGKYGLKQPQAIIDCGNSGTSIRLLTGLLAAQSFNSQLTGDASLQKRPMGRISRPLTQMGAQIATTDGHPPLVITGGKVLQGINYAMPEASAQVKSCLLLAGLYAKGTTQVVEPAITRDHTERMLNAFSYPVKKTNNTISIDANSECQATDLTVPGDISSAAFFIVAALLIPNSQLLIKNVGVNPTRTGIIEILLQMGAAIQLTNQRYFNEEPVADLLIQSAHLKGITIPQSLVSLAIDEFPILFIAAACAQGKTIVHGAQELRFKESDRIGAMITGLQRLGIQAEAFEDGACITGGEMQGGIIDSFHDHRIAMAFAIAGAVAKKSIFIKNCANVATSFPTFIKTAHAAQLVIEESSDEIN